MIMKTFGLTLLLLVLILIVVLDYAIINEYKSRTAYVLQQHRTIVTITCMHGNNMQRSMDTIDRGFVSTGCCHYQVDTYPSPERLRRMHCLVCKELLVPIKEGS